MPYYKLFQSLGLKEEALKGGNHRVYTPIDGSILAEIKTTSETEVSQIIQRSNESFLAWRQFPPPKRGELIRIFAETLRESKESLGELVTLECGKLLQEGLGEVQEMIDICDFAVGLSRQLYGLTIASERPKHRMMETWHPLGPVGAITAFNFPVAVWAWNFAISTVCGNSMVWKPSEKTPLCALACKQLFEKACQRYEEYIPEDLLQVVIGGRDIGQALVSNPLIKLITATGSVPMGKAVGPQVAQRLGRSLLELGGNNAMIVSPSADLPLALRAILFSAVGTAGQRCTTLRRLIVHESIYHTLIPILKNSFQTIVTGNPLNDETLVGPLIDEKAYQNMQKALERAREEGGEIFGGERVLAKEYPDAYYVKPAIVEMPQQTPLVCEETFAPILYVMPYQTLDQAIEIHNAVPQGLASCIFTNDIKEAEHFMSFQGSDCGIVNVNIGPSGAEIGGAFGGEKDTGGGRESGSDAWKAYMRRATNTINYSGDLPLAQGIHFGD